TDNNKDALEHLADHIVNGFEHGHRLAVYVLLITGTTARMTRWDWSGSIYTDAFDYVKRPDILRDLLWRFSLLSGAQQGLDSTVSAVSPKEHKLMDTLAAKNPRDLSDQEGTEVPPRAPDDPPYVVAYVRKMFAASLNPNWPRWKTSVEAEGGRREFLAGMPQVLLSGLIERGTREYVAYDCMDKRFVWLKDTWRPDFSREGETVDILATAGVKNIPTVICHGETGHAAQTPLEEPKKIRPLKHYRLVLEEVCRPLGDFLCARDLVVIVRDAIIGVRCTISRRRRDLAGLLHRDVSAGNILVCPMEDGSCYVSKGGLLGDWEHAKNIRDDGRNDGKHQGRRQTERVGTWQYISAYSLDHPLEPMTIADDIESFFSILLRCGVRYLRHNCSNVPTS
ncbi:hypothetical protein BD413DRAFT_462844, partial [Trametes elegans]